MGEQTVRADQDRGKVCPVNPVIENNFRYHNRPGEITETRKVKYKAIHDKFREVAYLIDEVCPPGRDKSVAFTQLETAMMWANSAVARNDEI